MDPPKRGPRVAQRYAPSSMEAERVGALVEVAKGVTLIWWPDEAGNSHWEARILGMSFGQTGPTPWAALAEALESVIATEEGIAAPDTGNFTTLEQLEKE